MTDTYFRQCDLQLGTKKLTAWLLLESCVVGNHVQMRNQDGWEIMYVYETTVDQDGVLLEREHFSGMGG